MQNFRELGAPPQDPRATGGWGLHPQTPKQPPLCEFLATRLVAMFICGVAYSSLLQCTVGWSEKNFCFSFGTQ